MIVAGFDPGWNKINYAMVQHDYNNNRTHLIKWGQLDVHSMGPKDYDNVDLYLSDIAHKHFDAMNHLLSERPVIHYAFIEKPLFIQNGETTIKISIAAGAILFGCRTHGIHSELVTNSAWKKATVDNGNAKKDAIAFEARRLFDLPEYKPDQWDVYDAALIAYYGALELLKRAKEEDVVR